VELIAASLESFILRPAVAAEGCSDPLAGQYGAERRREPRFPTNQITFLHSTNAAGLQRVFCRILDFSARGMRVRTECRLEPGTELRVTLREMFAFATVCYCHSIDGCFDHGIQVKEIRTLTGAVPPA
jgi:hypothetical protein